MEQEVCAVVNLEKKKRVVYLLFTECCFYFTINFDSAIESKAFYSICSSLNSLILEIYFVYKLEYYKHGWIFFVKERGFNTFIKDKYYPLDEYHLASAKCLNVVMKNVRAQLTSQLRLEKSFQTHKLAYENQCKRVQQLIPSNKLFLHTSVKTCNRMKKQRLTISEQNRASLPIGIFNVADLFTLILRNLSWLTSRQSTDIYWKTTQSIVINENEFTDTSEKELVTSISIEINNLNTRP